MLTVEKIRVYRKYGGDMDGLARADKPDDASLITDEEWFLIDSLVQKLFLMKTGKASQAYAERISVEVHQCAESEEVIRELMEIAEHGAAELCR
jgi:hypothetical protein